MTYLKVDALRRRGRCHVVRRRRCRDGRRATISASGDDGLTRQSFKIVFFLRR